MRNTGIVVFLLGIAWLLYLIVMHVPFGMRPRSAWGYAVVLIGLGVYLYWKDDD
jgi:hypothetical protein